MQFDAQACPEVARFSPDGQMLVVGLINGFIEIYDPKTGRLNTELAYQERDEFMVHKGAVLCLAFCRQGDYMLSGDQFGDIKLWRLSTGQCIRMFESAHSDGVTSLSFSKNNDQVLSTSFDQTVRIHGVKSAKALKVFRGHTSYVNGALWTSDGQVVSASSDGYIRVWNAQTEDCLRCFQANPTCPEFKRPIHTLALLGYQDHFLVSDRSSQIQVMNKQGEILKTYRLSADDNEPPEFTAVTVSPKGNWIYAVASDQFLYCLNVLSGEVEHSLKLHDKEVIGLHHHPLKNVLLSFSAGGELKLWKS
ncbi:WD40 repeat-containing protein SMU1-like [Schistocerca gregaria]|uniref:WD40 repeat-containing protein SMU1-like n=1 Tax=Schistocerca gregaria TaxID=7010 RepID=UPI00211F3B14|nr:WD40 repeat-containing protein SMU1-like [Schistocerca gregaria]